MDGNAILERAKAHFAEISGARRELEVEEWGVTLYFQPLTLDERNKLYAMAEGKNLLLFAHAIIAKAEDIDGKKVFSKRDLLAFRGQVDSDVIMRIGSFILNAHSNAEDLGE